MSMSVQFENFAHGWVHGVAETLGADYHAQAISGIGVTRNAAAITAAAAAAAAVAATSRAAAGVHTHPGPAARAQAQLSDQTMQLSDQTMQLSDQTMQLSDQTMPDLALRALHTIAEDDYRPCVVVLYLGSNDFVQKAGPSQASFTRAYGALVDKIMEPIVQAVAVAAAARAANQSGAGAGRQEALPLSLQGALKLPPIVHVCGPEAVPLS
jgi:hypothetical protein